MNHITDKTQVSDLSQIQIPKCYEIYVNKAIAASIKLLTIKEFIDITGFEVNAETFDILFMNINDEGIGVYINKIMTEYDEYTNIEINTLLETIQIIKNWAVYYAKLYVTIPVN